jgi:DNA-binding PucR family transcriptional regulator
MTPLDKEIIKGMADNNMNMSAVAKSLYMHRNTVEYHIEKVQRETGLNARKFYDLAELLARIDKGKVGTDEARTD